MVFYECKCINHQFFASLNSSAELTTTIVSMQALQVAQEAANARFALMKKAVICLLLLMSPFVAAKDITKFVIENTNISEEVANACLEICGNRGWSKFDSLEVSHSRDNFYKAVAKGSAKFHNVFEFAGGMAIEYLIRITVNGTLNVSNCILTVDKVHVIGDTLGIAEAAKSREGTKYRIQDCKKYTEVS